MQVTLKDAFARILKVSTALNIALLRRTITRREIKEVTDELRSVADDLERL